MPKRVAALVATVLAGAAATLAWAAPAVADTPGFAVKVTRAPLTFTIGKDALDLDATVTTDRPGNRCRKVRWELLIQTQGISLDQIRVGRVENGQPFQVSAQLGADTAQVVDVQLDPGQLCQNQGVSARWQISFDGPDDGQVAFEVRANDANGRLLASTDLTSRVLTAVAAQTSPTPSKPAPPSPTTESPSPTFSAEPTENVVAPVESPSNPNPAAVAQTGGPSVLGPGLIVGAVLVFVGVALLLRLRTRNRKAAGWPEDGQAMPTGFYNLPRR